MAEPVKSGTISQICLTKDNKYYDVCDAKSREDIASLINKIYPVGSIYMTMNNNFKPQDAFGGTWEKIQGKFLLGASNNGVSNTEGGNSQITLAENQIPMKKHTHPMSHTHNISHTHGMGHTHTMNDHFHYVNLGSHDHDFNDFQGDHLSKDIFNSRRVGYSGYLPGWAFEGGGQGIIIGHETSTNPAGLRVQPKDLGTKPTGKPSNNTTSMDNRANHRTDDASTTKSGGSSRDNTGEATVSSSSQNISPINIMPPYITVHMWRRTA